MMLTRSLSTLLAAAASALCSPRRHSPPIRSRSACRSACPAPTASSRPRWCSRPNSRSTRSTPRAACSAASSRWKSPTTPPARPARRRLSTRLVFQKKVDVLISMETSAARNAGLPIVARGKVPYIYTSFYEGQSCRPYHVRQCLGARAAGAADRRLLHQGEGRQDLLPDRSATTRSAAACWPSPRPISRRPAARWSARNICRWTAATGRRSSPS